MIDLPFTLGDWHCSVFPHVVTITRRVLFRVVTAFYIVGDLTTLGMQTNVGHSGVNGLARFFRCEMGSTDTSATARTCSSSIGNSFSTGCQNSTDGGSGFGRHHPCLCPLLVGSWFLFHSSRTMVSHLNVGMAVGPAPGTELLLVILGLLVNLWCTGGCCPKSANLLESLSGL